MNLVVDLISDHSKEFGVLGRVGKRVAPYYDRELPKVIFNKLKQCNRILKVFIDIPDLDTDWQRCLVEYKRDFWSPELSHFVSHLNVILVLLKIAHF